MLLAGSTRLRDNTPTSLYLVGGKRRVGRTHPASPPVKVERERARKARPLFFSIRKTGGGTRLRLFRFGGRPKRFEEAVKDFIRTRSLPQADPFEKSGDTGVLLPRGSTERRDRSAPSYSRQGEERETRPSCLPNGKIKRNPSPQETQRFEASIRPRGSFSKLLSSEGLRETHRFE